MVQLTEEVAGIVSKELDRANQEHPLFSSPHEGYGVLLEEIEESEEDIAGMTKSLCDVWKNIKEDKDLSEYEHIVRSLQNHAILAASENIQVAAMCQKYLDSMKGEK